MASSRPEQRLFSWRMPTSHEIIHQQHWTFNSRKESQACLAHYLARHGESRVAKAALISAVPPLMVKTDANPNGLPKKVFDDFQLALAANRSSFYRDVAAGPFYGYNRPGTEPSEAVIENWWRQGMMRRGTGERERRESRDSGFSFLTRWQRRTFRVSM
jgi:pimeloyl-ACP methyl ester carboxylesterase